MNKIETKPKQKKLYDIKLECNMPCTLTYRILADDENDAILQIRKHSPNNIKHNINLKRDIKATVYEAGYLMIKLIKNFRL